jgi:hypothetical protein
MFLCLHVLVPLASQGELIGLLVLGPHLKGEVYTSEARNILATLAPQVAPALRLAQLVQEQVEAHSLEKEMFGFPRLQKLLEEQGGEASLIETLLDELHRFTGEGWEQENDVTLVTLQRSGSFHG